jgi:nitronate monooxygenase
MQQVEWWTIAHGAHGLNPEAIRKVIREIKDLTAKPFAINLWVSMENGNQ